MHRYPDVHGPPPASTRPMTMGLIMVPMPHMQCSQLMWRLL